MSLEWIQELSTEWIAVGVASGALVVSLLTLVVALLILRSARRSEHSGEERLEMMREQRERLNYLHEERRLLLEELAEDRRVRGAGGRVSDSVVEEPRRESPQTPVERPEGEEEV
jgi:hypothetical protein